MCFVALVSPPPSSVLSPILLRRWISGSGGVPSLYLAAMAADEEEGCRPRTMREMLRNKKLCIGNMGASPLELPSLCPQQLPSL